MVHIFYEVKSTFNYACKPFILIKGLICQTKSTFTKVKQQKRIYKTNHEFSDTKIYFGNKNLRLLKEMVETNVFIKIEEKFFLCLQNLMFIKNVFV